MVFRGRIVPGRGGIYGKHAGFTKSPQCLARRISSRSSVGDGPSRTDCFRMALGRLSNLAACRIRLAPNVSGGRFSICPSDLMDAPGGPVKLYRGSTEDRAPRMSWADNKERVCDLWSAARTLWNGSSVLCEGVAAACTRVSVAWRQRAIDGRCGPSRSQAVSFHLEAQ